MLASAILLAILGPAAVAIANLFQAPVTNEFGISNSAFAINNLIVLGMGIFLSPIASKLLAAKNFRLTYTLGIFTYVLGLVGYSFSPNLLVFYMMSFLVGIGYLTSTVIPVSIMITNWFFTKRGLAMSLAMSGLGVGGFILSPTVTWLLNTVGWRSTYFVYGIAILMVCLPLIWFVCYRSPEEVGLTALGSVASHDNYDESIDSPNEKGSAELTLSQTMKKPFFILLVGGAVFVGLSNNGGLGQFPPFLTGIHGIEFASMIIAIYSIVGVGGKLLLGYLSDKIGVFWSTLYASMLLVLCYGLMLWAEIQAVVILAAIFFGLGNAIGTVLPPLITASMVSNQHYSTIYGYVQSGVQLGMATGSLLVAFIADTFSYNHSWLVMMGVSIIIAVLWMLAYSQSRKYI